MNRRFRASYKIAIGFIVFALLIKFGPRYANDLLLGGHFVPLVPGDVNIIGVDTSKGYAILIENRAAKLIFGGKDSFEPGKMDATALDSSGGEKQFVPIKEMLKSLRGDIPGLSYFVQKLNKISDDEKAPNAPVWKIEDIERAINGDKVLAAKLEHDLNVKLDGTPLDTVSQSAVYNGILVDLPVPVKVSIQGKPQTLIARVKRSYQTRLMQTVMTNLAGKFTDQQMIASQYAAAVNQIRKGVMPKDDVKASLMRIKNGLNQLEKFPEQILNSITTIVNENQITGGVYKTIPTNKGDTYKLIIDLTDEGKRRLWQFSRDHVGQQLLITVNGVAIAAPFIENGIAGGEIQVTGLQDENLVKDAVATIEEKRATTTK